MFSCSCSNETIIPSNKDPKTFQYVPYLFDTYKNILKVNWHNKSFRYNILMWFQWKEVTTITFSYKINLCRNHKRWGMSQELDVEILELTYEYTMHMCVPNTSSINENLKNSIHCLFQWYSRQCIYCEANRLPLHGNSCYPTTLYLMYLCTARRYWWRASCKKLQNFYMEFSKIVPSTCDIYCSGINDTNALHPPYKIWNVVKDFLTIQSNYGVSVSNS